MTVKLLIHANLIEISLQLVCTRSDYVCTLLKFSFSSCNIQGHSDVILTVSILYYYRTFFSNFENLFVAPCWISSSLGEWSALWPSTLRSSSDVLGQKMDSWQFFSKFQSTEMRGLTSGNPEINFEDVSLICIWDWILQHVAVSDFQMFSLNLRKKKLNFFSTFTFFFSFNFFRLTVKVAMSNFLDRRNLWLLSDK